MNWKSSMFRGGVLALAGVSAVCAASVYLRPVETARSVMRLRLLLSGAAEARADADGLSVRYFDSSPEGGAGDSGDPVILVHGLGGYAESWVSLMLALSRKRRIISPDLAGFGETSAPPEGMSFSSLTLRLAGFLDALGLERVVLVGNSLGGAIAIRYAAENPDRVSRLFLLNSAGLLDDAPSALEPDTREEAQKLWEMTAGAESRLPGFFLDDVVRRAKNPARRAYLRSDEPTDVREDLPRVKAPTTIIWGDRDGLIPVEHGVRMRETIEDAELITLPGASHVPQAQDPRKVAEIITQRL